MKNKKIAVKRFKITKNGKLMHRVQGARHLRSRKDKRRQRRQDKMVEVGNAKVTRNIKTFLGK